MWEVLGKIPQMTGEFFEDNKQPLISLGIILLGIISVKILIAVLDAINDIPLLAPTLQMIGMATPLGLSGVTFGKLKSAKSWLPNLVH